MTESPKGALLVHNISKKNNIGQLVRSAVAFNLQKIYLVSKSEESNKKKILKQFNTFGSQGTAKQIEYHTFTSLKEAKLYFVENQMTVIGVEIMKESKNVVEHPFAQNTVFLMGNEGQGLLECHKYICDKFIYIPQYTDKTASLNVACAATIIFHHFAMWAQYKEQDIIGEKFKEIEDKQEVDKSDE